jgi:GNAT superfamily N-acetyltransferase
MDRDAEARREAARIARVPEFDFAASMRTFRADMEELNEAARHLRHLIEATGVRVESEGREVAVTVTYDGRLVGVEFLAAAADLGPEDQAAAVIATHERAVVTARRRAKEAVALILDPRARTVDVARRLAEQAGTPAEPEPPCGPEDPPCPRVQPDLDPGADAATRHRGR